MTVRMGLIKKKPDWTQERFDNYWRDHHGPLAAGAPRLREYWQNVVTDKQQQGIEFARGAWDVDGFSQLSFNAASEAESAFGHGTLAADLIADEKHFLGGLHIVTAESTVVIAPPDAPARGSLLKRMSLITRLPGMSGEDFRREWRVHADFVRTMSGVDAYRQNVIVAREREKGVPCDYEELPIDGVVEMWFRDADTLRAAFASPQGQRTMAHAKTFLGEITAFLVEERRIV